MNAETITAIRKRIAAYLRTHRFVVSKGKNAATSDDKQISSVFAGYSV